MKTKYYLTGFSLIEVSVSLLILGIISSISITQFAMFNKVYSLQKTHSNIDYIVKSIAAYCIANDFELPFPSQMSKNIGMQDRDMQNSFGVVPFKSIGIMEKFAKNGTGKWLLYKMNPYFCKKAPSESYRTLGVPDFSSAIPNDKVAFVIQSPTESGNAEITVWYGEKSFITNFTNGRTTQIQETNTELDTTPG
jgi:prepilin-type N-terminal cleavage/methylation domain-containing protein